MRSRSLFVARVLLWSSIVIGLLGLIIGSRIFENSRVTCYHSENADGTSNEFQRLVLRLEDGRVVFESRSILRSMNDPIAQRAFTENRAAFENLEFRSMSDLWMSNTVGQIGVFKGSEFLLIPKSTSLSAMHFDWFADFSANWCAFGIFFCSSVLLALYTLQQKRGHY